jgi:hypothetical protein
MLPTTAGAGGGHGASSVYSGSTFGGGGGIVGSSGASAHGSLYGGAAVFPSWSGTALGGGGGGDRGGAGGTRWVLRCLRRGAAPGALDWESVAFQVVNSVRAPAKAYRMTMMRKQTKNVWARDDPGVALVAVGAAAALGAAWGLAFGVYAPLDVLLLAAHGVAQLGAAVALVLALTRARRDALTRPRVAPLPHMVAPALEWAYVAEVAVNAYFPLLLCVHAGLLVTAPVSLEPGVAGTVLANALLAAGVGLFWNNVFRGFVGAARARGERARGRAPLYPPARPRSHTPPSPLPFLFHAL